jgi:hypothetical protein
MDEPTTSVSDEQLLELDPSVSQRDAARRVWRRDGALIIGAAVIVGALAAALIVAWRGGDDDEPVAQRTVAPTVTATVATPLANLTAPSSITVTRTELARASLASGEVVRFEEMPGTNVSWCLVRDVGRQESTSCFGLGPMRPTVTAPQLFGPPSGPGFFTFVLPAGFASGVTVRDSDGAVVPSARSSDGTVLLVLDPDGRTNGPPTARPGRAFDLVASDGAVVARVTTPGFTGISGGPTTDPRIATVACLRAQGLTVPEPIAGPPTAGSTTRYSPELAARGWQSCRDTYARALPPTISLADQMARLDCMAAQGWLIAVSSGPPADSDAYNAAMAGCTTQLPSRKALIACLQSRGLQVSEPPVQPFPAAVTAAAWQQCRNEWTTASGAPAQVLTRYDCMAGQGWIMALITGPPEDATTYSAASRNCQ